MVSCQDGQLVDSCLGHQAVRGLLREKYQKGWEEMICSTDLIPIYVFNSYALLLYITFLSLSLFLEVQLTSNSINSPLFITFQVHWVDQAWRVFGYSCIPTSFSSGLLTAWRAAERFFVEYFGFLFDNTSLCYLCVCIFLPFLFTF